MILLLDSDLNQNLNENWKVRVVKIDLGWFLFDLGFPVFGSTNYFLVPLGG
jgi:hypothetical protein